MSLQLNGYEFDHQEGVIRTWQLIRRALLTNDAQPGLLKQQAGSSWPPFPAEEQAYGYTPAQRPRFNPSPRDLTNFLPVMAWLVWLKARNNGSRDYKILWARAHDAPWWKIAQRFGRSRRETKRWMDGAITMIYQKFEEEVWHMEVGP